MYKIDDEWVRNNKGLVWSVVNRFSKGDDDLFQVAIIAAMESATKYRSDKDASFTTYIRKGMMLAVSNELRKDKADKRNGSFTRCTIEDYMDVIKDDINTERDVQSNMMIDYIFSLPELTEREKEILRYSLIDEMTCREIASVTSISRARVNQLSLSARQKLRGLYEREVI